jgi:hypothetical protein
LVVVHKQQLMPLLFFLSQKVNENSLNGSLSLLLSGFRCPLENYDLDCSGKEIGLGRKLVNAEGEALLLLLVF